MSSYRSCASLYQEEEGWSSLNREKEGDFLGEHPYTRKDANPNEAAEDDFGDSKKDGIGFDLMSFHVYMIA